MSRKPLPEKTCAACGRPFTWRRRRTDCWADVKYCSRRCWGERARGRARPLHIVEHPWWRQPDTARRPRAFIRKSLPDLREAPADLGLPMMVRRHGSRSGRRRNA